MINVILNVPEATTLDGLSLECQESLRKYDSQFTGEPMPGTQPYNGRKLISGCYRNGFSDLFDFILLYGLDWTVEAAVDGWTQKQTGEDADGNPVMATVPNTLQAYDPTRILPFIQDELQVDPVTEAVTRVRPTTVPPLNRFQGQPPFEAQA